MEFFENFYVDCKNYVGFAVTFWGSAEPAHCFEVLKCNKKYAIQLKLKT